MVYSPEPMDKGEQAQDLVNLAEKVRELEELADSLDAVPDAQLLEVLNRTVRLLQDVNGDIEARTENLEKEAGQLEGLLGRIDFGTYDAALEELDKPERGGGGS